jgi:transposase-like protein/IS1 family transposase
MAEAIRQNPVRFAVKIAAGRTKGKAIVTNCRCCQGSTKKIGYYQNRRGRVQRFQCVQCGASFSETQPLDGLRVELSQAAQVMNMLFEGCGINAIVRLTGLHKSTVLSILEVAGQKCERFMADKIQGLKPSVVQIDELYSYVLRRPEFTAYDDPEKGEFYAYLAIDRASKLIITHHVGKRNSENAYAFMQTLKERTTPNRFQLASDGNAAYIGHIGAVFQTFGNAIDYGTEVKAFGKEIPYQSLRGQATRKFNRTIVKWVKRIPRIGEPEEKLINTSHAERLNLTMRLFNRRFTRCTLGYSKKLDNHKASVAIFACLYNFCRKHSAHRQTPAQSAGLTDSVWTPEQILMSTNTF